MGKTVVAIGNFDGVHAGHKALLKVAKKIAGREELVLVVCTFEPHPRAVLFPEKPLHRLTTETEKEEKLHENGVDEVHVIPFTKEFSQTSAQDFMDEILGETLQASYVVVGKNFRFGYKAEGDADTLQENNNFETLLVDLEKDAGGEIYSSRRLRG